ncbi:MAG: 23S rRNA (pseudouridine(1915)-N(3))-methyltransferase RlmH [Alphaproteobacteria bacterium]|jgi:23S rRNA (pseudouridine1915-N3)-methyltransferase|nr:23S rRNA (pseudouridine(1915)-N(3))-methyltransferase RlmH [Alphaproteobacteria bacterium]MBL6776102.1 23S rRNA (pseudouridine(1915)-N(3))-methyltransferase RlmH [Alphaproteobacteria bacterium]
MKLNILAIGRAKPSPETELVTSWMNRLPYGGNLLAFESSLPSGVKRQADESGKITDWLDRNAPSHHRLVCLDPQGQDTSSEALAKLIGTWRDEGVAGCYFAIGGADGHHHSLQKRASKMIAFGRATWPHMLCRVMLAEQLYRAEMILKNHPYHRGN